MDIRHQGLNNSNIMPRPARPRPSAAARLPAPPLPAYALYGEPQKAGLPELLHLETIERRSRVHDWEIRPHRHASLCQFLVIASGRVQARLDSRQLQLDGPCALTVPAMAVHGFRFSPAIDGMVVTVAERQVQALLAGDAGWRQTLDVLRPLAPVPPAVLQAAQALRDDYGQAGPWRAQALDTGLRRLLLELARAAPVDEAGAGIADDAPHGGRALQHVRRFQALVEAQFRHQPGLPELAAPLGITPTQLNRVCHRVLGHSALGVLHARLLLEAQRELGYTTMSVKQVAIGLGFADAGYFTRWFRRLAGRTPSHWRQAAAAAPIIDP
ncbi:MAG: hypothetical protein RJA10_1412 [Pseudomonadota bacterium]|jgi:AraC family transcriptional activator of pobA